MPVSLYVFDSKNMTHYNEQSLCNTNSTHLTNSTYYVTLQKRLIQLMMSLKLQSVIL